MEYNNGIDIIDIVPSNKSDYLHRLSVAVTHYIFRNGPIQDVHKISKLTNVEMKELNIFMTNRIAYICLLLMDEDKIYNIKECCDTNFINETINVIINYCFLDGPIRNKYNSRIVSHEDMNIIINYMYGKLGDVVSLILSGNEEELKNFLLISYVFGLDWEYAVPAEMEFQQFLEYFKQNKNLNISDI